MAKELCDLKLKEIAKQFEARGRARCVGAKRPSRVQKNKLGSGNKKLSECVRTGEIFGLENNWNYWNGWKPLEQSLLGVFKSMAGLNPQVKRKFLFGNPRRF